MNDSRHTFREKRVIPVVCGIVFESGKILVTQRGPGMKQPLKWEFPGGKLEEGEQAESCLHRELEEELGIKVKINGRLPDCFHDYGDFCISLIPLVAEHVSGNITLHEHANYKWVVPGELDSFDWAPADIKVVAALLSGIS